MLTAVPNKTTQPSVEPSFDRHACRRPVMPLKQLTSVIATAMALGLGANTAHALNVSTHSLVNQAAGSTAGFGSLLQRQFGLLRGLAEPFGSRTTIDWIGAGGIEEDDGDRFLRHFHDPLRPWDNAGLPLFESSIRWMQRDDPLQGWSWQQARRFFHVALTNPDPVTREGAWADTFRALGQVMHLVVDASVPEHTRNDPHPKEGVCRLVGLHCYGNYEYWVSDQHPNAARQAAFISTYLASPIGVDPTIVQRSTGDVFAPVPVARLIDTDTYTGADPNVTLTAAIGIAEISNANFFSEDTVDGRYPFPRVDRLEPLRLQAPKTGRTRAYFRKGQGDGLPVSPALAECVLYFPSHAQGVGQPILDKCVDENVWAETARLMLPRAVGYARGALDYFFRGRIEVGAPSRFVYGLAAFQPGNTGAFTQLRFKVRNATPDEDTGPGQMIAVVRYRAPINNVNLIDNPAAPLAAQPSFAVSHPVAVTLTRSFQEIAFDFSDLPLPTNAADVFLTVVYRGRLGLEEEAVMVGGKDLFEPDPLDSGNYTDYDCFAGESRYVVNLPAYTPPVHAERDVNRDGVQDLFGPWVARNNFVKTFDLAQAVPTPGSSSFDFRMEQELFAEFGRFILLQDQPSYGVALLASQLQEVPSGLTFPNFTTAFQVGGVFNDLALGPQGQIVRRVVPSAVFRGVPSFHHVYLANQNMAACQSQVPSLTPNITRIDGSLPLD